MSKQTDFTSSMPYVEFADIPLAAELLGVSEKVVEHWLYIGAIGACAEYSDYRHIDIGVHNATEINRGRFSFVELPDDISRFDEFSFTPTSQERFNEELRVRFGGIWAIKSSWAIRYLIKGHLEECEGVEISPYFPPDEHPEYSYVFDMRMPIRKESLLIMRSCLLRAERSLNLGEPLGNNYSHSTALKESMKDMVVNSTPRATTRQSDLIVALIDSDPELRDAFYSAKKSKRPDILIEHFNALGINPPVLDEKNLSNWIDKATINPTETLTHPKDR